MVDGDSVSLERRRAIALRRRISSALLAIPEKDT